MSNPPPVQVPPANSQKIPSKIMEGGTLTGVTPKTEQPKLVTTQGVRPPPPQIVKPPQGMVMKPMPRGPGITVIQGIPGQNIALSPGTRPTIVMSPVPGNMPGLNMAFPLKMVSPQMPGKMIEVKPPPNTGRIVKRRKFEDDEYEEDDDEEYEDDDDEPFVEDTRPKRRRPPVLPGNYAQVAPKPIPITVTANTTVANLAPTTPPMISPIVPIGYPMSAMVPMGPPMPMGAPTVPINPPLPPDLKKKQRLLVSKKGKEFLRWTPQDDLLLKEEAQRTASFEKIASRVKFSQKFLPREIEERWKAMLYDPSVSRDAAKGMILLPTNANKRVLWTVEEEQILKKEANSPQFVSFQSILEQHRDFFHSSRTAKSLEAHFYRMKRTGGLSTVAPPGDIKVEKLEKPPVEDMDFEEVDEDTFGTAKEEAKDIKDMGRVRASRRAIKKEEKQIEDYLLHAEHDVQLEFERSRDPTLLAMLRGKYIRYPIKTKEVVLGRGSKDNCKVDVNLADEGPCAKISRLQAIIKVKRDACFYIKNMGKKLIFVNGQAVESGKKRRLPDNSIIEIGDLRFIFEINRGLWVRIRKMLEERLREEMLAAQSDSDEEEELDESVPSDSSNDEREDEFDVKE